MRRRSGRETQRAMSMTDNPPTMESATDVCAARERFLWSRAPKKLATTTLAPTDRPPNSMIRKMQSEPVAPTAASDAADA